MPASRRGLIGLLTALTATGPVAVSIYLPSLPAMARDLEAGIGATQLTLTVYLIGFAAAHLIYGPLADRHGRRPVLIVGLLLFAAAGAACAVAPNVEFLIAARLLQSLGACAGPVIGRAVVRDLFERDQVARVMAWIGTALALAPALAPIIGGYLQVWFGWRLNFVAAALYGALVLWLVWRRLGESLPEARVHTGLLSGALRDYLSLARRPEFMAYSAIGGFGFAALFAFQAAAPIVVIDLIGVAPDAFGLLSLIGVAGYAVGSYAAGLLAPRVHDDSMALGGVLVALAGALVLAGLALAGVLTLSAIYAPIFVYAVGMGLFLPFAVSAAINPFPEMAGAASALMGFVQSGLGALGSLAVVPLPSDSSLPMALVIAAMMAASLATLGALAASRRRA